MTGELAGQPAANKELDEDAAFWGLDLSADALVADNEKGIWREHWPALQAYLAISTQWRMVADFNTGPRAIGLDYAAAEVGLKFAGIEMTPDLWSDVKLIEIGARSAMNGTVE